MNKQELRKKMLEIRNTIPLRAEKSKKILEKLEEHKAFTEAKSVLFYYNSRSEAETVPLIRKYADLKKIYLPKVIDSAHFVAIHFSEEGKMNKSDFNIMEPEGNPFLGTPDLIIVPGVAFDKEKGRLGMGKGYYDRYLKNMIKVPKIALAFEEQMLESIPKEPYDVPVDIIITDKNIY